MSKKIHNRVHLAWYFMALPAFFFGCMVGWAIFAAILGSVITEIWYGPKSYMHPDIIGYLGRPAMFLGGTLASGMTIYSVMTGKITNFFRDE